MDWEPPPLGPNALADEEADKAFHARHEAERRKMLSPQQAPFNAKAFRDSLASLLADLIVPLMKRLDALEQRSSLSFAGKWVEGLAYKSGELVQFQGGLWMCTAPTEAARPNSSPHWKLLVKRGAFNEEAAR
jgi:hypothetical protein